MFVVLAGILHLGDVLFEAGGGSRSDSESCTIPADNEAIKTMAGLLEIDEEAIRKWLCHRQIITARETFVKPMNTEAVIKLIINMLGAIKHSVEVGGGAYILLYIFTS